MKKIVSMILAVMLLTAVCIMPAMATGENITTAGGTGTTPVVVNVAAATFSVTVPTSLPVTVNADGTVTVSDTAVITNSCNGPVKVTNVAITATEGWTLASYSTDMTAEAVNTQKIGLQINTKDASSEASLIPAQIGTSGSIAAGATAPITYLAKLPSRSVAISDATVANITFTIAWDAVA